MFDKKDMMVSVIVAEQKIEELKDSMEDAITKYANVINLMKDNWHGKGYVILRNISFSIGKPTGQFTKGIEIFTGDEVRFKSGKLGVVVEVNNQFMIYTNKEIAHLVTRERILQMRRAGMIGEGNVTSDNITLTKHFNTYADGEEVAKGRSGAEGFIVKLNKIE